MARTLGFWSQGVILLLWILGACFLVVSEGAGVGGVNYGRIGDNLPSPPQVVKLLQSMGMTKVKLYDADTAVLQAFAYSGIQVVIALPNEQVASLANSPRASLGWVRQNVAAHPNTRISAIAVGNEVMTTTTGINTLLLQAMKNLHAALAILRLDSQVKVSTPHSLAILGNSFPPSAGVFATNYSTTVVKPILDFLAQTGSFMMINAYPYFAYRDNQNVISNDYALLSPSAAGVTDPATGFHYANLLEAQTDAVFAAMAALGHKDIPIVITETGWPSKGDANETSVSIQNAQTFVNNLIRYVRSTNGTPLRPGSAVDVYIFALFNEDRKPGPTSERNYGMYYPDESAVYTCDISGKGPLANSHPGMTRTGQSWCVALDNMTPSSLQTALDYACGPGGANCVPLQPGQNCYMPNTLAGHASYAFNSYYQKNARKQGTCYFGGSARITTTDPSTKTCQYPSQ